MRFLFFLLVCGVLSVSVFFTGATFVKAAACSAGFEGVIDRGEVIYVLKNWGKSLVNDRSQLIYVLKNWGESCSTATGNPGSSSGSSQSNPPSNDHQTHTPDNQSPPTNSGNSGNTGSTNTPVNSGGSSTVSTAFGIWQPNPKYDTCTKEIHDSYYVIGPDGKKYPTWHPPIDPKTGCKFGHEHGKDPRQYPSWRKIQEHYAYDANKNGTIDAEELAVSGLPFGLANETLTTFNNANGLTTHRHEDHVGHKVEWAVGPVSANNTNTSNSRNDLPVNCNYFAKIHQGVHSKDAFSNNLHEVMAFIDCKDKNDGQVYDVRITKMISFGKPGEFNQAPPCRSGGIGSLSTLVKVGFDNTNSQYMGESGQGAREIGTRDCAEQKFLVPSGKWSENFYEIWVQGNSGIKTADNKTLVHGVSVQFAVFNPARYYWKGQPNDVGYTMDLCYQTDSEGQRYRGGTCDSVTNYGKIQGITWDDPRSGFKGDTRETYFQAGTLSNKGGPVYWYTDPYGLNGKAQPFPGSIRQYLTSDNINWASKYGMKNIDTSAYGGEYGKGNGVHAPN